MLGLALVVTLLAAMIAFVWNLLDRKVTLTRGARDVQAGCAIVERMENDLIAGFAGDGGMGAGVVGEETKLKLLSRGVWLPVGAGAASSAVKTDVQGTEYAFDAGSGRVTARRWCGAGGSGDMEVLSERVERMRLRYFDGRTWRQSFDSLKEGGLPVAIEVAVWFTALKNDRAPGQAVVKGADGEGGPVVENASVQEEKRWGEPSRLRVIVVPDGPEAGWREGA